MIRTFKTKISIGIAGFIGIVTGGIAFISIYEGTLKALFIVVPLAAFLFYFLYGIRYTLKGADLLIACKGLYSYVIPISSIRKINETWSIISSPAASTDRLEIVYNTYDSVMISPKDKTAFIRALTEINPGIQVSLKNNGS